MEEIVTILSTREWAIVIWGTGFFVWMLTQSEIRKSLWNVIKILLGKNLRHFFLIIALYVAGITMIFYQLPFWNNIYLKDFENINNIDKDDINVNIYSDNKQDKINIKLAIKDGNIYIQSENKVEVVDENSSIELVDDHYKKIDKSIYDEEKYKAAIDVEALSGEVGYSPLERTAIRPTFDICGIWGGYTGEGAKTVLPSKAYAKVSCRLVPHQNHEEISKMFIDYIYSVAPRSVKVKVSPMHGGESYVCPINLPAYRAAEKGYELAFGKRPLAVRRGGSIPIIATFEKVLGVKSVLMGFGLESDATHSPNENFLIEMYEKGIIAVVEFYNQFGH